MVKVGQFIFGGYATASWEGSSISKQAAGSFVFSMRNRENIQPFKAPLKNQYDGKAIYAYPSYGPVFGDVDFAIYTNAASSTKSFTDFGDSYQPPSGVSDRKTILAGTYNFTPSEVEVFYLV